MTQEVAHDVVGCVISADPWYKPKILLVKRRSKEEGERYWAGRWCYLTEHRYPGETDKDTIARCLKEELGLPPPKWIVKGPVGVESRDPDYHELFRIQLYQCLATAGLKDRMDIDPALNPEEASRWIWTSTLSPFPIDAAIQSSPVFEDLYRHLDDLFMSPLVLEEF